MLLLRAAGAASAPLSVAYGESVWDALRLMRGDSSDGACWRGAFYDAQRVCVEECSHGSVAMRPMPPLLRPIRAPADLGDVTSAGVPFGRAAPSLPGTAPQWGLSVKCPVTELQGRAVVLPKRFPHPKLAVVVLAHDGAGCVLLTRRTPHMRIFPRCWVFPGGGVDDGEDLLQAGSREMLEETGMHVPPMAMRLLCFWESVFPTSCEGCLREGLVKGHSIVAFVTAAVPVEELSRLRLQRSECDRCAWVPLSLLYRLHSIGAGSLPNAGDAADCDETHGMGVGSCWRAAAPSRPAVSAGSFAVPANQEEEERPAAAERPHGDMAGLQPAEVSLAQLRAIYPNGVGEGIGQGHLFAISVMAEEFREALEMTCESARL